MGKAFWRIRAGGGKLVVLCASAICFEGKGGLFLRGKRQVNR